MLTMITGQPYLLLSILFTAAGCALIIAGIMSLFRGYISSFALRCLSGLFLSTIGATSGLLAMGIQGYQALTREEIVATILVSPIDKQQFSAHFHYPDGRETSYIITGDEIYVDAHILKWKPLANLLGLHTSYELDRVGGRYRDIEQERNSPRTIHRLSEPKNVNLFELRQLHTSLSALFDAQYGSATFIPVTQTSKFELKVSTTGLLMRELNVPLSH